MPPELWHFLGALSVPVLSTVAGIVVCEWFRE